MSRKCHYNILEKTIEGYLDSFLSLAFNIIKTELNIKLMYSAVPDFLNQNACLI